VFTSSYVAAFDLDAGDFTGQTYTDKDWAPFTLESALKPGQTGAHIYSASKTLAEKAAWDYANQNGLKLVTLLPPLVFGPPLQPVSSKEALNTSVAAVYSLIDGPKGRPVPVNIWVHNAAVDELALAHVRALERDDAVGKRFLFTGTTMLWEDVSHIKRPA
jgi:nucleoside-diphosphate-sugar epimerase